MSLFRTPAGRSTLALSSGIWKANKHQVSQDSLSTYPASALVRFRCTASFDMHSIHFCWTDRHTERDASDLSPCKNANWQEKSLSWMNAYWSILSCVTNSAIRAAWVRDRPWLHMFSGNFKLIQAWAWTLQTYHKTSSTWFSKSRWAATSCCKYHRWAICQNTVQCK